MSGDQAGRPGGRPGRVVVRVCCRDYRDARRAVRRAVELVGGEGPPLAAPGEPLLVKPNLLSAHPPEEAVTTHPAVLDAVLEIASDLGARARVADSPGLGSAERVAGSSGLLEVCRRHGVPLLDLGRDEGQRVRREGSGRRLDLAREALEARWIWNLPKWKTHTFQGLTLAVKNLFGTVQGRGKVAWHFRAGMSAERFAAMLLDIEAALRPAIALSLLDGVVAMEGAGPSRGTPLQRGLLLASRDSRALDWEAARLSVFSPALVPTVDLSLRNGSVTPRRIRILGDSAKPIRFRRPGGVSLRRFLPGPLRRLSRCERRPLPRFDPDQCRGCGVCWDACPGSALRAGTPPDLEEEACIRCYCCQELCPEGAVEVGPVGR